MNRRLFFAWVKIVFTYWSYIYVIINTCTATYQTVGWLHIYMCVWNSKKEVS